MEVYADIIEKAKEGKSVGPYSLNDLANRLSPSITSATDDGILFDVIMSRFRTLKERSLILIQNHLKKEIFEELRQYTNLFIHPSGSSLTLDTIGLPSVPRTAKNSATLQSPTLANSSRLFPLSRTYSRSSKSPSPDKSLFAFSSNSPSTYKRISGNGSSLPIGSPPQEGSYLHGTCMPSGIPVINSFRDLSSI